MNACVFYLLYNKNDWGKDRTRSSNNDIIFLCDNFATVSFDRYDGKDNNNNIRAGDSELHSSASIANYRLFMALVASYLSYKDRY